VMTSIVCREIIFGLDFWELGSEARGTTARNKFNNKLNFKAGAGEPSSNQTGTSTGTVG
jgi:hypothetical protein